MKTGRIVLLIICLNCIFLSMGIGQHEEREDLIEQRKEYIEEQVESLEDLIDKAEDYFPDSKKRAAEYANQVLEMAPELYRLAYGFPKENRKLIEEIKEHEIDASNILGKVFLEYDNKRKAARYFRKSLHMARSIDYDKGAEEAAENLKKAGKRESVVPDLNATMAKIGKGIGDIKVDNDLKRELQRVQIASNEMNAKLAEGNDNYTKAIELHLKTIRFYQGQNDTAKIKAIYQHIGDLYSKLDSQTQAIEYIALAGENPNPVIVLAPTPSAPETPELFKVEDFQREIKKIVQEKAAPKEISEEEVQAQKDRKVKLKEAEELAREGKFEESAQKLEEANALQEILLAFKNERQLDSLSNELILGQIVDNLEILEKQQIINDQEKTQSKLSRNLLILALAFFLSVAILAGFLFMNKRSSHRKLSRAYEKLEQTHQGLKATQSQLVNAEKMASLGQLTAGIAHEINNPINFVSASVSPIKKDLEELKGWLEGVRAQADETPALKQLQDEYEPEVIIEEMEELLESIHSGATRTRDIVLGLRNFSRLDEDEFKEANLHEGLDSTLTLLTHKLKGRIELVKEYGSIPLVSCRPGKINQVFMNVLSNAIDAIPEGEKGKIFIQTEKLGETVRINIQDTGQGISEESLSKVFDPFYTTKEVGKGTGLGMSISYGIVEQHKGNIQIKSEEGKGTEVEISLPV